MPTPPLPPPRRIAGGDETGASIVMAVIIMLVLSGVSAAVVARTLSVLNIVRHGQDFDAALAVADAGLADALFKIDQRAPASWDAEGTTGAGTFKYYATKRSESDYVISSVGEVGRSKHAIQARITRTAQFPYVLFSREALSIGGTLSAGGMNVNFYSYNAGISDEGAPVRIGSNDRVVCNGTPDPNVHIDWYQGQSECPSTKLTKLEKPRDLRFKEPPPPDGVTDINWQNCPDNGVFGISGTTITNPVVIDGNRGPFVCRQKVTLLGTLVPDPNAQPVQIFVAPTYDATTGAVTATYELDMMSALINPLQPALMFQIFKAGAKPIKNNGNTSASLTARMVLWAPDSPLVIGGGLWWAGSFTVGQMQVNGAPNIILGYDNDLATYLGPDWKVSRYREIASSQVGHYGTTTTTSTTTTTTTTLLGL